MVAACITLLTDFGPGSPFVGVCHAVAQRLAPGVPVIDLAHDVPPCDVRCGAIVLAHALPHLPPGVHVAVVDPGVGTARPRVAAVAGDHAFVGPDNGVLSFALAAAGGAERAVLLDDDRFWWDRRSTTFDGRDVFVPVAAHLARGTPLESLGSSLPPSSLACLPEPIARLEGRSALVEVLVADRFGNLQTAGREELLERIGVAAGEELLVERVPTAGAEPAPRRARRVRTFGDADPGELVVLLDSDARVALAVNLGSAHTALGISPGELVRLRPCT